MATINNFISITPHSIASISKDTRFLGCLTDFSRIFMAFSEMLMDFPIFSIDFGRVLADFQLPCLTGSPRQGTKSQGFSADAAGLEDCENTRLNISNRYYD